MPNIRILQEFLNSDIKIISLDKLNEYIDYCLDNNQGKRIKGKTSHHHILPRKLFPEYSKLKDFPWNGSHLLYADHYYAHWLLTEAIDDFSQLFAFCAMHNKDIKLGRIDESDLIPSDEFQVKKEESNNNLSKLILSKEWKDSVGTQRGKNHSLFQNTITETGLTNAQNAAIIRKENYDNHIESYNRISLDMKKQLAVVHEDGKTEAQRRFTIGAQTRRENGNDRNGSKNPAAIRVKIYNADGIEMYDCMGNINKTISENNLPSGLLDTYRNNTRLFENSKPKIIQRMINRDHYKYKGWFARKIHEF